MSDLADMDEGCGTELAQGRLAPDALWDAPGEAKAILDELVADALRYRQSPELKRFLTFVRGFRQYKPFNALLVDVQRPGSTYVLPANRWASRYGHRVKVGSTPLIILQPFGPVMFVHDVLDVEPMPGALRFRGRSQTRSVCSPRRPTTSWKQPPRHSSATRFATGCDSSEAVSGPSSPAASATTARGRNGSSPRRGLPPTWTSPSGTPARWTSSRPG